MGWFKHILPTAAGPGLVAAMLWAVSIAAGSRVAAAALGAGLGTAISILGLIVALIAMSTAQRWLGAIGWALAAAVASRIVGLLGSRDLGPISPDWEVITAVGVFGVYLILIAIGYGVRAARRSRSDRSESTSSIEG